MAANNGKKYHHDYYYGPENMTEHDDWRQADYDPRNQVPGGAIENDVHEPVHVTDEEIREEIAELLHVDPQVDPSEIEVAVDRGHVQLLGTVASRLMMQKALAHASSAEGVAEVENHLRLDRPAEREAA